jgi:hypothetical protein
MARSHFGPALIFWRAVHWLVSRRIEIPTSFRLTEAVSRAVQQRGRAIAKLIAQVMTSEVRLLLDNMLLRDEDAASQSPFQFTLLERLSQSTRPTKIRERLSDLGVLKELHANVAPILSVLNLGSEGIRYFAGSVARMRTTICAAGPMTIFTCIWWLSSRTSTTGSMTTWSMCCSHRYRHLRMPRFGSIGTVLRRTQAA